MPQKKLRISQYHCAVIHRPTPLPNHTDRPSFPTKSEPHAKPVSHFAPSDSKEASPATGAKGSLARNLAENIRYSQQISVILQQKTI